MVPEGAHVTVHAGSTITLSASTHYSYVLNCCHISFFLFLTDVNLTIFGEVVFEGSRESPIVITTQDASTLAGTWRVGRGGKLKLAYVQISNMGIGD